MYNELRQQFGLLSKTARFLTEDPYRGEKLDPLSLNLYAYCAGNPVKYADPSGHALTIAASIVVAVAVAVAGGAGLIYYFATDGPEKLLDVLKRDKPAQKGSNLPSTGGGGPHKNDFINYLLMAMSDPAFRYSPGAAIINAAGKSAFNDFCEWTEEVADYIDYTWRYCVNGEEMIVPVKGDVSVTLKFDRDMTMYVDGHVVEDNLVDGKTSLNEYLENKVALYEKNEGSLNSNLAQYGDDFGKMGQYVENPNIK